MSDSPSPLAVLFDLDQTLIHRQKALDRLLAECLHGQDNLIAQMRALDRSGEGDRETFFRRWRQLSGRPMNQRVFAEQLAARLCPDAALLAVLRRWSRRVTTGIITNGGAFTQWLKLRASSLHGIFPRKRVWISETMGIAKPDPMVFVRVCRELGIDPARCVYVGDSLVNDIAPARRAGLVPMRVREPLTGRSLISLEFQLMHASPLSRRHRSA